MTGVLVGPLPAVRFRGGGNDFFANPDPPKVAYEPPRGTLDPRYRACTDHHVACDCREAEWAEERQEAAGARRELVEVLAKVLDGHPTFRWDAEGRECGCRCTGCQIVRDAGLPSFAHRGAWSM